jgi:hypothetical protein
MLKRRENKEEKEELVALVTKKVRTESLLKKAQKEKEKERS